MVVANYIVGFQTTLRSSQTCAQESGSSPNDGELWTSAHGIAAVAYVCRLLVPQAHAIDHHISSFDGIAHCIDSAACTPFPALSQHTSV
jgi:hypothetical protein